MAWVYLDDHFPEHPKVLAAGGDAAWLFVCGLAYVRRHGTAGRIPKAAVSRLSDRKNPTGLAERLVKVELWHDDGDEFTIHNYSDWNRPAESRTEAARKAARARWDKQNPPPPDDPPDGASGNANASESHSDGSTEAHADPCPMPLAPALVGTSQESATTSVGPSTALSLLAESKRLTHASEIDQHITALVAAHGIDATEHAIQAVADRLSGRTFAWPSDVRKALEAEMPAPVAEAKPNVMDEAQRAQREAMLDCSEPMPWTEGDGLSPEERKARIEARRAERRSA